MRFLNNKCLKALVILIPVSIFALLYTNNKKTINNPELISCKFKGGANPIEIAISLEGENLITSFYFNPPLHDRLWLNQVLSEMFITYKNHEIQYLTKDAKIYAEKINLNEDNQPYIEGVRINFVKKISEQQNCLISEKLSNLQVPEWKERYDTVYQVVDGDFWEITYRQSGTATKIYSTKGYSCYPKSGDVKVGVNDCYLFNKFWMLLHEIAEIP